MAKSGPGDSIARTLAKLRQGQDAAWEDKDEVLDIVFWARILVSFVWALAYGLTRSTGFVPFALYAVGNFALIKWALQRFFGYLDEDVGVEHLMEGLPVAMSTFLLTWVLSYTAVI